MTNTPTAAEFGEADVDVFENQTVSTVPDTEESLEVELPVQDSTQVGYNLRSVVNPPQSDEQEGYEYLQLRGRHAQAAVGKGVSTYKQALLSKDKDAWIAAYSTELDTLERVGELKVVLRTRDMRPIPFLEVLSTKVDNVTGLPKFKVRLTARGDLVSTFEKFYSPVVPGEVIRCFFAVVFGLGWFVHQADITGAYLYGRLPSPVVLYLPRGHPQWNERNDIGVTSL